MTVDGGSLLYGLGEDRDKRLTVLSPIGLEGTRERIAQIVQTSISEPPFIRVHALSTDSDASKGATRQAHQVGRIALRRIGGRR
jgi:hypothetical protein